MLSVVSVVESCSLLPVWSMVESRCFTPLLCVHCTLAIKYCMCILSCLQLHCAETMQTYVHTCICTNTWTHIRPRRIIATAYSVH